jgi:hypothetical protein
VSESHRLVIGTVSAFIQTKACIFFPVNVSELHAASSKVRAAVEELNMDIAHLLIFFIPLCMGLARRGAGASVHAELADNNEVKDVRKYKRPSSILADEVDMQKGGRDSLIQSTVSAAVHSSQAFALYHGAVVSHEQHPRQSQRTAGYPLLPCLRSLVDYCCSIRSEKGRRRDHQSRDAQIKSDKISVALNGIEMLLPYVRHCR